MIACVWLPHFTLRVLTRTWGEFTQPVAVCPLGETHASVLDCNDAALAHGVDVGTPLSRALGSCPDLQVVEYDEARVAAAAERFLQRLESIGAAVQPLAPGRALFAVLPLARMYGGVPGVVAQLGTAFPTLDTLHVGIGANRFVAEIAAYESTARSCALIAENDARDRLARLSISVLPVDERTANTFDALGLKTLADIAAIDVNKMADRFGDDGIRLWQLAQGIDDRALTPRVLRDTIAVSMSFPDATGSLITLQRATRALVDQALAHPQLRGFAPRSVTVLATLVTGGSWQSVRVLRQPTISAERIAITAVTEFEQIPAPVEQLIVRFDQCVPHTADQPELVTGAVQRYEQLHRGVRHVQETIDDESVLSILEIAPDSRIPERRALLVPADPRSSSR